MGYSNERQIEIHNEMIESDEKYREDYERWCEDVGRELEMEAAENFDLFGYKMDCTGYIETYRENKN